MPSEQIVIAAGIVRNTEGKFLMQRRKDATLKDANGKWEIPGGKIRFDERPEDAAKREVKEETGCDIEIERLLPYIHTNIWHRNDGTSFQVFILAYLARYVSGTPAPQDDKVMEVRWFTAEEVTHLECLTGDAELVALAAA